MKNWKTTSTGIVAIAGGIGTLAFEILNKRVTLEIIMGSLTAILSGIGLIFAKDYDQTGKP